MRPLTTAPLALPLGVAATSGCHHRPSFDDPAKPLEVRAGSEFELDLKANHSTGYEWVLVDSAALGPLRLVAKHYAIPRRERDVDGAGGTERWIFRTEGPGE